MDNKVAAKLLQLNAEFYQTFAIQFSNTRERIQPGVRRLLDSIDSHVKVLDLGCGNGELARELARRGFSGRYIGLDFSEDLLRIARKGVEGNKHYSFAQVNLADPDWSSSLFLDQPSITHNNEAVENQISTRFDVILAFATLHHLPGRDNHLQILQAVRKLVKPDGCFLHSNWQFLNSERLRKRIHPWEEIGLSDALVDSGDYLLDWRRGGFGLRYVHHFEQEELKVLAAATGFRVAETFYSDGETGDLGLYQVWEVGS